MGVQVIWDSKVIKVPYLRTRLGGCLVGDNRVRNPSSFVFSGGFRKSPHDVGLFKGISAPLHDLRER